MPVTQSREKRIINRTSTVEAGKFVDSFRDKAVSKSDGTFDSAAANEVLSGAINQSTLPVPESLQAVFDEVGTENSSAIIKGILDGVETYEREHGTSVPSDIIEYAMHMAYGTTKHAKRILSLDSASNTHADNLSLQPNRAVVAILSALGDAIPFAHYLPADISSNEAKLAILSHVTGGQYGLYAAGASLDGANSGDAFITSSRVSKVTVASAAIPTGQLTSVQATRDTCAAVAGAVVAVNLLRGRSMVYINGKVVAREISTNQGGSGNSTISGSVTIASTTYQLGGTINTDTGAHALTSSPMLPDGTDIVVEGFIDYERQPSITPNIISNVETFQLFAKPWRVFTQHTIDSQTQMSNELGLDPYSESIMAIQSQFGNERHYEVLAKAFRLAVNNTGSFDMAWSTQGAQKTRAQVIQDLQSVLGQVSQQMAINTFAYGVSHLYVGKYLAAQFLSLPSDIWQASGVQVRPSVFRLGRLFGMYDVYYTPKIITESNSTSQMLCVGRAPDVTRNPFVLGDAVPPTVVPLGVGTDMKRGAGFYARNFTEVNPHGPSAMGCALISVTNMGL